MPPLEDKLARWKREADEQMAHNERARRERDYQALETRVTERVLATMQGLVNDEHDYLLKHFLPELLACLRHEISDEITSAIATAYERAFADVRADFDALRQAVKKLAGDENAIIDLPPLRVGKPFH